MKGKIMLDGSRRLNSLNLESSTDVGQGARPERQRLGMVLLPTLILGAQIEGSGVLQVRRKHYGLVPGLAGELYPEIP